MQLLESLQIMRKRQIYKEIADYIAWKETLSQTEHISDENYLFLFAERTKNVRKLSDIRLEHVEKFCEEMNGIYQTWKSVKALRCFLRYHHARGRVCIDPRIVHIPNEGRSY